VQPTTWWWRLNSDVVERNGSRLLADDYRAKGVHRMDPVTIGTIAALADISR
jgi:hypothetical protein